MYPKKTTREILSHNEARATPPGMRHLKVWLHDIRSLHNTGSAFRSCDAFGVGELLLSGFTPIPPRPEITKTALGAEEHVDWKQMTDPLTHIRALKKEGYIIAGIEQVHDSILLNEYLPKNDTKICVIFGNEVTGIYSKLLPELDICLEIPQFGMKHSLNISVTVGIVLFHFMSCFSKV